MTRKMTNLYRNFAIVIVTIFVCAWSSMADKNGSTSASYTQPFVVDIRMPGVRTSQEDEYLCYGWKVPDAELYIVKFEALATASNVHHLLVFGCSDADDTTYRRKCYNGCNDGQTVLFAWAQNAPPFELPADVGFKVGKESSVKYIVIQLHYRTPIDSSAAADHSGIQLTMTPSRQRYTAGIFIMLAYKQLIPAHQKQVHADVSCRYNDTAEIHPFAFRTHAHSLCTVISGYQVASNGSWHLMAKGNPQWPQAFYRMSNHLVIQNGDYLVSRCTYDATNMSHDTGIGWTHNDEMCNLYVMYYAENGWKPYFTCISNSFPDLFKDIPADNDVPLPPNARLNAVATGHVHKGIEAVDGWPKIQLTDHLKLGQVSGVTVDSNNNVHIFHRGARVWDARSFHSNNTFALVAEGPVQQKTVVEFDAETGEVINQWGDNFFYMPHGLEIDVNDSFWITDVALHQIMRFKLGSSTPDLVLGERFVPGSDTRHFCKPTDVAVLSTGEFFVSDGYCNDRIIKFSKDGKFLMHWGKSSGNPGAAAPLSTFALPHSVTVAEDRGIICVADRENGRVQCFDLVGNLQRVILVPQLSPTLYAVAYDKFSGRLYAVNGPASFGSLKSAVQASIIDMDSGNVTYSWQPKSTGFKRPHDIAVSNDGRHIYIAEIGPNLVWQFINYINASEYGVSQLSGNESGASTPVMVRQQLPDAVIVSLAVTALVFVPVVLLVLMIVCLRERRNRHRGTWRHLDDAHHEHGTRLSGFKPLIVKRKPYRDVPDSDDSETEEFNINISRNSSTAYRTQQRDNQK